MTSYLHNLRMRDQFCRPLTTYEIASAFPDCRDVASREMERLSIRARRWKTAVQDDPLLIHFMATDPEVKQINALKLYLRLTEPFTGDKLDIDRARYVPIESMYDFQKQKRNGKRIHCCCPFHQDTNPSFVIYLDSNSYFCFSGCGGGDSIDFASKLFGINFVDTVKKLTNTSTISKRPRDEQF